MTIQFLITIFAVLALIGVMRGFKRGTLSRVGVVIWMCTWIVAILAVWNPNVTNLFARVLGVGRGADAVLYVAIVILLYVIFKLYGKLENLEHQLSELVKKIALKDLDDRKM